MGDIEKYIDLMVQYSVEYGLRIIGAIAIFVIGKWIAKRLICQPFLVQRIKQIL